MKSARRAWAPGSWRRPAAWAWAMAVLAAPAAAFSAERGVFGLAVQVTGDGVLDPAITQARVSAVTPGLPAAQAGVQVDDELLEVDGRRVPGARARDLAPLARGKRVGETVSLRIKRRGHGEPLSFTLVAVPRPASGSAVPASPP